MCSRALFSSSLTFKRLVALIIFFPLFVVKATICFMSMPSSWTFCRTFLHISVAVCDARRICIPIVRMQIFPFETNIKFTPRTERFYLLAISIIKHTILFFSSVVMCSFISFALSEILALIDSCDTDTFIRWVSNAIYCRKMFMNASLSVTHSGSEWYVIISSKQPSKISSTRSFDTNCFCRLHFCLLWPLHIFLYELFSNAVLPMILM